MKSFFKLIIVSFSLLFWGLMIGGCRQDKYGESVDQDTMDNTQINGTQQSAATTVNLNESTAALDSLNTQMVLMAHNISEQKMTIIANEKEIKDLRRNSVLSILIACGIGVVSLIIAILAFVKAKAAIVRLGKHRKEIEELKRLISKQEARFMDGSRNFSSKLENRENSELSSRLYRIERKLKELTQSVQTQSSKESGNTKVNPSSYEQSGYFDLPTQKSATEAYFQDWSRSRSSESRFKATIKGENAQFYLLEGAQYLNEIKSNDTIQMVLDLQGSLRSEANHMRIMNPGEARLVGNRWEITKKVKIELSK